MAVSIFDFHDYHCKTKSCPGKKEIHGFCRSCAGKIYRPPTEKYTGGSKPMLTKEQGKEIKKMYARLMTKREIAKQFNVSASLISRVVNNTYNYKSEE